MPGHVTMTTVSPAKMRGKNLRFLSASFPFLSLLLSPSHSIPPSLTLSFIPRAATTAARAGIYNRTLINKRCKARWRRRSGGGKC